MSISVGLATESTEPFEFFLREFSDLCGKRSFSPFCWTLPIGDGSNEIYVIDVRKRVGRPEYIR